MRVVLAALLCVLAGNSLAEDEQPQSLVALASRNAPPTIIVCDGTAVLSVPSDFAWSEQRRVASEIQKIVGDPQRYWNSLVRLLNDTRYCVTVKYGADPVNLSLGQVCTIIVNDCLTASYYDLLPETAIDTGQAYEMLKKPVRATGENLQAWCHDRVNKPLYEVQAELATWAIGQLRLLDDATSDEQNSSAALLKQRAARLLETKRPLTIARFSTGRHLTIPTENK